MPFQPTISGKAFNPSALNDPIALKTRWTPIKSGGTCHVTYRFIQKDPMHAKFKPALSALIIYGSVFFSGVALSVGFPFLFYIKHNSSIDISVLPGVLSGLFFIWMGCYLFKEGTIPIIFDRTSSLFWKKTKPPLQAAKKHLNESCSLDTIYALQILSEKTKGRSPYTSYELNLVLKNGSRLNIIDHSSLPVLREDAEKLKKFLNVPLWDSC